MTSAPRESGMISGILPDPRGYSGAYGGRYVPEVLVPAVDELEEAFLAAQADPAFEAELNRLHATYTGRPTPLSHARHLSEKLGGAVYLLTGRTS